MNPSRLPLSADHYRALIDAAGPDPVVAGDFADELQRVWSEICAGLAVHQGLFDREGRLDLAVDDASVTEIVRLIGYEPLPAVAASTRLIFTMRDRAGGRSLRAGLPVRSVPADGQDIATFELNERIDAREQWNSIGAATARSRHPFVVTPTTPFVSVELGDTTPRRGHHVLLVGAVDGSSDDRPCIDVRRIRSVERVGRSSCLRLFLDPSTRPGIDGTMIDPEIYLVTQQVRPDGADAVRWDHASDTVREPLGTRLGWVASGRHNHDWAPCTTGLPPVDVLCLAVSHDETFYAGTDGCGVYRLVRGAGGWEPFGDLEKVSVTAITTGAAGRVLAGTDDERVLVWTKETERWEPLGDRVQRSRHGRRRGPDRTSWPRSPIRTVLWAEAFGRELVFVGTDRGVFRWINERKGWRGRSVGLPDWDLDTAHSRVDALAFDPARLELFAATSKGVYRSRSLGVGWWPRNRGLPGGRRRPPRVVDLLFVDDQNRNRPVLHALTEDGVHESDDGARSWCALVQIPARHRPARRLAAAGVAGWFVGTSRGVLRWDAERQRWQASDPMTSCDPNLVDDPMCDVSALVGHLSGRLLASSPRRTFREREWPRFWIDVPSLFTDRLKHPITPPALVALRHGDDVAPFAVAASSAVERSAFGMRKHGATLIELVSSPIPHDRFPIRSTDVFILGPRLRPVDEPSDLVAPVRGQRCVLDGDGEPPPAGRWMWCSGAPARARILHLGGIVQATDAGWSSLALPWRDVRAIEPDAGGGLLAAIDGAGLWRRPGTDRNWHPVRLPSRATAVAAIATAADGSIVITTDHGWWRSRDLDGEWQAVSGSVPDHVLDLVCAADGTWWCSTEHGLHQRATTDPAWTTVTSEFAHRALFRLPDGRVAGIGATGSGAAWTTDISTATAWQLHVPVEFPVTAACVTLLGDVLVGGTAELVGERRIATRTVGQVPLAVIGGLDAGIISPELASTLGDLQLGHDGLVVTPLEADAFLLTDTERRIRVVVERCDTAAVLRRLPGDLRLGDSLAVAGGVTVWPIVGPNGVVDVAASSGSIAWVRSAADDESVGEFVRIASSARSVGGWELNLETPLRHAYDPERFAANANVAEATAGETIADEILGSGDAAVPGQVFMLGRSDLVYVTDADGLVPALSIDVVERSDDRAAPSFLTRGGSSVTERRRWDRVASLHDAAPDAEVYEVVRVDDATTLVRFGDGVHGARLPTGHANVVATYRCGAAAGRRVGPGALTVATTRPPGVRAVTNPIGASGGAPPERLADIRRNAPRSTRRPERIVTLSDHEWFARTYGGVEHARAERLPTSHGDVICLTVGGFDGVPIDPGSPVLSELADAVDANRSIAVPVAVVGARWRWVRADVVVDTDEAVDADDVVEAVRTVLLDEFSTARADFGAGVSVSDVVVAAHSVPGVVSLTVASFGEVGDPTERSVVRAQAAVWDSPHDELLGAGLVAVNAGAISVTAASSIGPPT